MSNREKFQEVFGFNPSDSFCYLPACPVGAECDTCKYYDWLDHEYKEEELKPDLPEINGEVSN